VSLFAFLFGWYGCFCLANCKGFSMDADQRLFVSIPASSGNRGAASASLGAQAGQITNPNRLRLRSLTTFCITRKNF
jgi:hypothetical protein